MKRLIACAALVILIGDTTPSLAADRFDIKGYSAGVAVSSLDLKPCHAEKHVDSGMGGYICDTTIAGEPAKLKLAVFDGVVAAVIANVDKGMMTPIVDALTQKFGPPSKPNRYIEEYTWRRSQQWMIAETNRVSGGYKIMIIDSDQLAKSKASLANKAKGDI